MTIPETKNKWINRRNYLLGVISSENSKEGKRLYKTVNSLIEEMIADLDTLPECNGVKIDYVKETCTSCGCKNHDQ